MKDLSMSHPYNLRERRAVKEKASKTSPANASTPLDSPPSRLTVTLPVTKRRFSTVNSKPRKRISLSEPVEIYKPLHELALPMEMEQSPECHEFIIDTQGSPKLRKKLPESFWNDDDGSNEIRPTREGSPLTLLGWPETYEEDKYYASSQPSLSKCERGSPLLSDKPVRRSLMSELMMNAENESVEEELSDQERRKSFIQSFIEAEMEEDERAEDLTDLPPITAPPPRRPSGHYESTFSSNAAYDDDIDAFFSNSHAEDNGPEFVLSAAYKMSLLHNKPHRQDFITLQPHFLTAEYFKTHKPNDGQPAVEEEDERKVNPAPYYSYQFKFMGRLGSGEYADVWRAQDVTTQKF
ncbi:hypothetical protein J3Q64DRAFT_1413982 [Phycomyces blakesleeanus]|uniref:Protein kinase domain-containing protein n=1 Tax=Phycomyces blakesleeanus TaxID=4837 RepID=A0ABR3B5Y2_PHYBL